jgi:hypothetical protein
MNNSHFITTVFLMIIAVLSLSNCSSDIASQSPAPQQSESHVDEQYDMAAAPPPQSLEDHLEQESAMAQDFRLDLPTDIPQRVADLIITQPPGVEIVVDDLVQNKFWTPAALSFFKGIRFRERVLF